MVGTYPTGPTTPFDRLQADLKRKAAQLDAADNQISLLQSENAALKAAKAELEQAARRDRSQASELSLQLTKAQALLKQREAAVASLGEQLQAAKSRQSSSGGGGLRSSTPGVPSITPKGPLSRQNSDEEALLAELADKASRISALESQLAEARAHAAAMTPRRRDSVDESGVSVVGNGGGGNSGAGGVSSFDANRLRTLRGEVETWKDRSESLMAQVRELQRQQQASYIEKGQLADSAASLSEKVAALEEQLRASHESLAALRALADQGRQDLKSELQRKGSDLGRAVAAQEAQAAQLEELKAAVEKGAQDRERLVLQAQQLQAQLAKQAEEARETNQRVAQLVAVLEDKTLALEAAEVELRDMRGGKVSSDSHRQDLQARLAALGKEKTEVEAQLRQVSERMVAAVEAQEQLAQQLAAARERGEGAGMSADALRQQLTAAQKEIEAKERALGDMALALEDRHAELEAMRRSGAAGDEGRGVLLARVQALEASLAGAKDELAAKSASLAELASKLQQTEQEAADHAKAAEDAVAALRAGQGAIDRSRAHGSGEIAQLQEFVRNANARCEELEGEVESRDVELEASKAKIMQMEGLLRQMEALNQKVLEGEGALRAATAESAGVGAELESARASLADRQVALESAHAAVAEKERKITVLEMDLRQSQAALATVEAQLQDRDERMLEQERRLSAVVLELSDLKHELRTAEMARQDLQREVDAARLEALHHATTVRRLEGEVEAGQRRIRGLTDDLEEARAPFEADQATKQQLNEVLQELAAERAAHGTTKQRLVQEAAGAAVAGTGAVAVHAPQDEEEEEEKVAEGAPASPAQHGSISPREAAEVRQRVLAAEAEMTGLQIADAEQEVAAAAQQAAAEEEEEAAEAAAEEEEEEAAEAPLAADEMEGEEEEEEEQQ